MIGVEIYYFVLELYNHTNDFYYLEARKEAMNWKSDESTWYERFLNKADLWHIKKAAKLTARHGAIAAEYTVENYNKT